jgi:hypothetical protein
MIQMTRDSLRGEDILELFAGARCIARRTKSL